MEGKEQREEESSFLKNYDINILRTSKTTDVDWAIGLNRTSLEILGIWPGDDSAGQTLFLNIRIFVNVMLIIFAAVIPSLSALIKNRHDPLAVIDNLQFTLAIIITSMKLIVIWWHKGALLPVVDMIAKDWETSRSIDERNVMIRQARTAKRINVCCCILLCVAFVLATFLPVFGITFRYSANATDNGRLLPLQSHYLYNVTKSPHFELTYLSQIISIAVIGICYTAVDNFLGLLLFHICGQLENLQARFTNMADLHDFDYVLAMNVQEHIRLIRLVEVVENTFNLLYLGLLMYFSTFICVYGFLIIRLFKKMDSFSASRIIFLLLSAFTLFGHTLLQFMLGEFLTSQFEGVHCALCNCEWEKLQPRKARYLILLLAQANKPFCISAGKIFPMTLPIFCKILKMSAGYVSFLLTKVQ